MTSEDGTSASPPHKLQTVSIPGFSGPLDLLLSLIEEGNLDISRVSLAAVTDQYLERVKNLADLSPEHLADFLVVAATLLLIKSKRLFADLPLEEEEEERIARLEEQLREYRSFRAVAKEYIRRWNRGIRLHARERFLGVAPVFAPPPGVDPAALRTALASVLEHLPSVEQLPEDIVQRVVSLEERIRDLEKRIAERARLTFQEVAAGAGGRLEVIVSFLAILELVRQRLVTAEQRGAFHDILVSRRHGPQEQR